MFQDDDDVPEGEVSMIKELNMISRISEIAGLTHVIPSLLAIKNVLHFNAVNLLANSIAQNQLHNCFFLFRVIVIKTTGCIRRVYYIGGQVKSLKLTDLVIKSKATFLRSCWGLYLVRPVLNSRYFNTTPFLTKSV